ESQQGKSSERGSGFHLTPHLHDSLLQLRVVLGASSQPCPEAVNTISRVVSDRGLHQSVVTALVPEAATCLPIRLNQRPRKNLRFPITNRQCRFPKIWKGHTADESSEAGSA